MYGDLFNELNQKIKELNISIQSLRKTGTEFAEAEKEYQIKLREEALKLRAEKGMPVTLIQQVVYGVPEVAQKRYMRDVKEAVYQANQEAINSIKLQIRVEDIIEQLTKIYLKEIDKEQKLFIMTRKDLADFCLKMMKLVRRIENDSNV